MPTVYRRMWWDGKHFSEPVYKHSTELAMEHATNCRTHEKTWQIEWCGLQAAHPAGYEYALIKTARLEDGSGPLLRRR